jgi:DNA-binding response OmpR family regulator
MRRAEATDRIALLGNDPVFLESVRDALAVHGWRAQIVMSADSLKEPFVPSVVVADVDSLQPDAEQILQGLRRRWGQDLRFLLVGSRLDLPELARAAEASAYVGSPFGLSELLAAVDRASEDC